MKRSWVHWGFFSIVRSALRTQLGVVLAYNRFRHGVTLGLPAIFLEY